MRRFVFILTIALSLSGCAWFQKLKDDPIAAMQDGVGYIRTAVSLASTAFELWATANPDTAADARSQFQAIVGSVDRGLITAQDGLRLAANARGPAPDVSALLRDAQTAMASLHQFLANLPGRTRPGATPNESMRAALEATERASRP
jgi:hypothetical protein